MQWLTPKTALYAAALTVPLLVLLYFLKLKRVEQIVSSTLLWQRAVQDLQVNAPFQRLRRNILLLLQLLALIAALIALAGPIMSMNSGVGQRTVLLIDRSASMNAQDGDASGLTRLEYAQQQAALLINSMRNRAMFSLQDRADQAMIIAFDERAKVMSNFSSDKRQLLNALNAITPTDKGSQLSETLTVARAFTQAPGDETNGRSAEQRAQLHLFSDGCIVDLDKQTLQQDELVYHRMGQSSENIAITAMQARRSYEQTDQIQVFASLAHFGTNEVSCDVRVSVNDDVIAVRNVQLAPARADANGVTLEAGRASVDVTVTYAGAGLLEVRQLQPDTLAADDAAWAVIAPPRQLSVGLVTLGNPVLKSLLRACPLASLQVMTPDEYTQTHGAALQSPFDVTVLDTCTFERLPRGRYLVFGQPSEAMGLTVSGALENQFVIDWRANHTVLKHVNLSHVYAAQAVDAVMPRDARVLAEFNNGPALALVQRGGSAFLWVGFDCVQSNWPFEPSFVLFCYNALDYLGMQVADTHAAQLKAGEPILVQGLMPQAVGVLKGPDMPELDVEVGAEGSLRFPGTDRVGPYSLTLTDEDPQLYAVNLLAAEESSVAPRPEVKVSGRTVQAQSGPIGRSNVPLWPYGVLLVLALVCVEWWVYNSKMRI
jgi:hypothetical protein